MAFKIVCTLVSLVCVHWSLAFPDGGPIDACVQQKANRPNHVGVAPQEANSNPYVIEADTDFYRAGDVITGELLISIVIYVCLPSNQLLIRFNKNFISYSFRIGIGIGGP